MKDNIPLIILLIVLTLILGVMALWNINHHGWDKNNPKASKNEDFSGFNSYLMVEDNTLIGCVPSNYIKPSVLSALTSDDLLHRIIKCESNFDPKACNEKYGCRAGMGLCMFISGTWNETLDRMKKAGAYLPKRCWQKVHLPISKEKTEIVFDAECNLLVGEWLLENDGDVHWREWSGYCYLK